MDMSILKVMGQLAGIGGLALGVFLLLLRDIIRKKIFPGLDQPSSYHLLWWITSAAWSIAVIGIVAWVWVERRAKGSDTVVSAAHGAAAGKDMTRNTITITTHDTPATTEQHPSSPSDTSTVVSADHAGAAGDNIKQRSMGGRTATTPPPPTETVEG
jgi:hypothetical protein